MSQRTPDRPSRKPNARCADLSTMAEQELTAFFGAVTELFGAEQAELSVQDWLKEMNAREELPGSTREWRSVTTIVASRLATRVNALAAAS